MSTLAQFLTDNDITVTFVFIPFSQSRHKADKMPGLNWKVTVLHKGREILTTDYGAGQAHCPAYKAHIKDSYLSRLAIEWECENGKRAKGTTFFSGREPILPDLASVLSCLASDASVIDTRSFEDWAQEFGYDTDSIKAKNIYHACLEIALKLRNGLGAELFDKLRIAAQDY